MTDELDLPIAYLEESNSAVFFSKSSADAGTFKVSKGTAIPVRQLQNNLDVAFWGEDNKFPQNIEQQMAYCGVGRAALDWKARALYGSGIVPGRIVDVDQKTNQEIFEPAKRDNKGKKIYSFLERRSMYRFWLEYLQDWTTYANCFPEPVLSNDTKTITHLVHQESCDSRFQQMNDSGEIKKVFLSKLWGAGSTQYAKFDPDKKIRGLFDRDADLANNLSDEMKKYVQSLDCIDMYNPVNSLKSIAENLKGKKGLKSAIFPTNYPSPNKTYYQVATWDGARLGGWVEIASKFPAVYKQLLNKAFRIKYHIQVPETYFEKLYGIEAWTAFKAKEKAEKRKELLKRMDEFLTGEKNAFKSFISIFDTDPHTKSEYGLIKITVVEDKPTIDKEIILSSAADAQILTAMQVHPTLFGAGTMGSGQQRTGGSDQREAFLVYNAMLNLERNVALEPLYLVRDYNREVGGMDEWSEDLVFRVRDTVLTTLDKNTGTEKKLS